MIAHWSFLDILGPLIEAMPKDGWRLDDQINDMVQGISSMPTKIDLVASPEALECFASAYGVQVKRDSEVGAIYARELVRGLVTTVNFYDDRFLNKLHVVSRKDWMGLECPVIEPVHALEVYTRRGQSFRAKVMTYYL
jgi:hypothetical protein